MRAKCPHPPLVAARVALVLRREEATDAEPGGGLSFVEHDWGLLHSASVSPFVSRLQVKFELAALDDHLS